jgi:type IV pilus assembly protein PilO
MNLNLKDLKSIDIEQFKNLDFNDAGAWPMPVKAVAIAVVCAAVLFAGYWFDTQNQLANLKSLEDKEAELKQTYEQKHHRAVNVEEYKQQMAEMEQSFGTMLRQLPSKTEVAALLVDVSQAGVANGLNFELFKPVPEVPAEFYAELPINIKVTGAYHDMGKFVSDVAALPRIVTLNDIVIAPRDGKEKKSNRLVMTATAKTFRYMEEDKSAKDGEKAK